jgi:hypothetical protein
LNNAMLAAHASSCSYPKPVTNSDLSTCLIQHSSVSENLPL